MRIDMVTLFPNMFSGPFGDSIIKRAVDRGLLDIHYTNFRDYTEDKHHHVDDTPFGGGSGMVLMPEPLYKAVRDVLSKTEALAAKRRVIIMDPSGPVLIRPKRGNWRRMNSWCLSAVIMRALMPGFILSPMRRYRWAILF